MCAEDISGGVLTPNTLLETPLATYDDDERLKKEFNWILGTRHLRIDNRRITQYVYYMLKIINHSV